MGMTRVTLMEQKADRVEGNLLSPFHARSFPLVPPVGRAGKGEMLLAESQPQHFKAVRRKVGVK